MYGRFKPFGTNIFQHVVLCDHALTPSRSFPRDATIFSNFCLVLDQGIIGKCYFNFSGLQRLRWQGGEKRLPEQWWVGDGNSEENGKVTTRCSEVGSRSQRTLKTRKSRQPITVLQSHDPIKKAPYVKGKGNEHLKEKLTKHGCQKFKDRTNKQVGKIPKSHADYQGK